MKQREWILALGFGLCAGLQPGCVAPLMNRNPTSPLGPPASTVDAIPQARAIDPVSPTDLKYKRFPEIKTAPVDERPAPEKRPVIAQEKEPEPVIQRTAASQEAPPLLPTAEAHAGLPPSNTAPHMNLAPPPDSEPKPPNAPIVDALLCLLNKHPDEAVKHLQKYDRTNQDLLLPLLPLAARLTEGSLDKADPQELAALVDQLHGMAALLRPRAALVIDKICFCQGTIEGYGGYKPQPTDHVFQAGSEGRPGEDVQVYVELRNFHSEPRGEFYVTHLASTVKIINDKGETIWKQDIPNRSISEREPSDRSRTARQDYFIVYSFHVPPNLRAGDYTLAIEINDVLSQPHRSVKKSLRFPVTATTCVRGCQGDEQSFTSMQNR